VSVLYDEICSPMGLVGRQLNAKLVPQISINFVFDILCIFVLHRKNICIVEIGNKVIVVSFTYLSFKPLPSEIDGDM
jgi:hypothetical protein